MTNREKIQIQRAEIVAQLKNKPINSTLTERWFLIDEATRLYEGLPQAMILGKGLQYILERASTPINECDILLGRFVDRVPTEEEDAKLQDIWIAGRNKKHPIVGFNRGHNVFDWETLVRIGITGYIEKTEARLKELKSEDPERKKVDFVKGMLLVYRAIKTYIERYAKAAEEAGMADCAEVCKHLSVGAPQSFREAMQLVLFVYTVYTIYAGRRVACLTLGRMDNYLLPFYLQDIYKNTLTPEEAGYIIDDFNCKLNLHLGRGEHQLSKEGDEGNNTGWDRNPAYDSPTYVVLGGYTKVLGYDHRTNPLTKLFAEHIDPAMKEPVYIYRWNQNRSEEVWDVICDRVRNNASILIYNDHTMISAMEHSGVETKDARNYTVHACNWPDIAGGYFVAKMAGETIPNTLYAVLFEDGVLKTDIASVEEIYQKVAERYRALIKPVYEALRERFADPQRPIKGLLSIDDCFTQGTLEHGYGFREGGVKYIGVYHLLRNIGTAADMMAAIDELVFRQKSCSLEALSEALKHNFEGYDDIYALCKKAPKFGTDTELADTHAVRLMNTLLDVIDEVATNENGIKDIIPLNVTITDMDHLKDGAKMKATPDGRRDGEPLSENLSPSVGYRTNVTSVLNSVAKLPFNRIHAGAHNVRLAKNIVSGERGLTALKTLLDTYFGNGGMQIQVSVADTVVLKKAQQDPDSYRDLMVRITGYSAIFTDMSKRGQDEVIRRDEMN